MNMALLRAVSLAVITGFTAVAVEADADRHRHGKSHRDHDRHQDYRGDRDERKNYHKSHVQHGSHYKGGHHKHRHGHSHNHWKNGYWHHGHRHGRNGWWWIAAGIWHWYPSPVYPYPSERVVVVDRPQPAPVVVQNNTPYWYYCDSARNYYPHVSSCPEGWRAISTEPRDLN